MQMSAEEVKQFWRGYCERRKVAREIVAKGEKKIDEDPEYWADQTMDELLKLGFTLDPTLTIYEASRDLMRAMRAEWHDRYTLVIKDFY